MAGTPLDWIDEELDQLAAQHLLRFRREREGVQSARVWVDGRELTNFGSNDYLGLAHDPRLIAVGNQAAEEFGWGSGASPLVTGRSKVHAQLEYELAQFEGTAAALLFSSGFAANAGTIPALVGSGDLIFSDQKNHASIVDGCRRSRANTIVYPHNDMDALRTALGSAPAQSRRLIVTDSLFSMDGDMAALPDLVQLACDHGAMLMVDEAHATAVFGEHGRGLVEYFGVEDAVHIRVGTLSKALGCMGGFVAGSENLIEWLANRARSYVFSTASPVAIAAAALESLRIVRDEPQRRKNLLNTAADVRECLRELDCEIGASKSQIIPLFVGAADDAVTIDLTLRNQGLLIPGIRPPTVPPGESLLRISLSFLHTPEMISQLIEAIEHLVRNRQASQTIA